MADVSVTHNRVTGAAANPNVLVDGPAWDEAHVVTGLENVQNVDTTNASNITSGTLSVDRLPTEIQVLAGGVQVFNPIHYDATGDGTTNDAVALQAAATAAATAAAGGASVVFLIDKPYATASTVLLNASDNMEVRFEGSGQINVIGSSASVRGLLVKGAGPVGSPTTITANATYGTRDLTVADATGIAAGDVVEIFVALGYVPQPQYGRGMVSQVQTVVGNVLTLNLPIAWDIDHTQTNHVQKFDVARNVKISGVKTDGASYSGSGGIGFLVEYLADSEIDEIYASNFSGTNGQGNIAFNLWACSVNNWLAYKCGDTASQAQELWYTSNSKVNNIRSYQSTGFGVVLSYFSGNTASDIVSEYSGGRGVKFYGSCNNLVDRVRGNYAQGTLVGVGITVGSSYNRINNVEALYNATSGLWFNGLGNDYNVITGVRALGNVSHDIWITATAPFSDDFNTITGVNSDAANVLNDAGNTGNVIQYLPNGNTTNFLRSDGSQTNILTGVMIAANYNANGSTNAASYNSVNVANFGGTAGGRAYLGDNIYWDEAGTTYRTNITNASVGYSLIELGLNGAITHAAFSGATTAGSAVTPTKVAVVKQGDTFNAPVGSASAPGIYFNDVDTGFYSTGAGLINVTLNGFAAQQFSATQMIQSRTGAAPNITAQRTDTHGSGQNVGAFVFRGMDSTATSTAYGQITGTAVTDTDTAEEGSFAFSVLIAGSNTTVATFGSTGIASTLSMKARSATAIPAGGTAGAGYTFSSTSNFGIFFGSGAPTLSAAKGSLYLRSDGTTTNDRMYVNTNGSTTWTAVTTAA